MRNEEGGGRRNWNHGFFSLPARSCVDPLASGFGGILWNVQKHRRSLEKRDIRKFGYLHWGTYKQLRANRRLRHDHKTGEVFELGRLPPNRYRAVMEETREIQRRMADAFGLEAKDKEVAVVYKGEEERAKRAATDRVKLVEMEKERPAFFSPNLLQKVHRPPSAAEKDRSTTTVRPSGLG